VLAAFSRNQALAGEDQSARVLGADALAMAEALGLPELQAHALNTIGLAKSQAGDRSWIEDLEQSVEIAKAANSREAIRAVNNLASLLSGEGDLRRALPLWHEAMGLAERFGDRQMVRFVDGTLIWAHFLTGDWNASVRAAYDFIAECEAGSPHYQESGARATRGLVRHIRGDGTGALEDTERAIELAREVKDPQVLLPALSVRARVCVELGRLEEAGALADEVIEAGRVTSAARQATMGELIWVADRLGRRHDVRALIAPIARGSRWTDAVLAVLGRDFGRAAALYGEIGAAPYEADARLRLAEQLIAEDRRGAAEAEIRQALEFYRAVGATRYIAESESLLAANGFVEDQASA
jgi:tetratricopeptide (TPR) repeat protein